MKKKPNEKKILAQKFIRCFGIPILIGIFFSVLFSVFLVNHLYLFIQNNTEIKTVFQNLAKENSTPVILNARNILISFFQKYINNLFKIRAAYLNINPSIIANYSSEIISTLLSNSIFNGFNTTEINKIKLQYEHYNQSEDFLLYRAKWYSDPNTTRINESNLLVIAQLRDAHHLLPLLKTCMESTSLDDEFSLLFNDTEIFIDYPASVDFMEIEELREYMHGTGCKNAKGQFPDYFYFKCRPYYYSLLRAVQHGVNFTISDLYTSRNGKNGVTTCLMTNKLYTIGNTTNHTSMAICQDAFIDELKTLLEKLNNLIQGYFFITKVNSTRPIYYPNAVNLNDYSDLYSLEFNIDTNFYSDEVNEYEHYIEKFTSIIPDEVDEIYEKINIKKGGKEYQYSIFPVRLAFINKDQDIIPIHLFSIIYVHPIHTPLILSIIQKYVVFFSSLSFLFMGIILIILSKYLISSIANNITRPIKLILKMLALRNEISTSLNNQQDENNNDDSNNIQSAIPDESDTMIKRKRRGNEEKSLNDNDDYNDYDDDSGEEDSYCSKNLKQLFETLMEIKTTYKLLNSRECNSTQSIPILVHSQSIFNEINNREAYSACQSNIASLFIEDKQYDKAISHLICAIEKVQLSSLINNQRDLKEKFKSENMSNRYLTLINCYKKYFKQIKHMKGESKVLLIPHLIKKYQIYVDEYLDLTKIIKDSKDLYLAILEKIEERISQMSKYIERFKSEEQKKNLVKEILILFDQAFNVGESICASNFQVQHIIDIKKNKKKDSSSVSLLDIPKSILVQKTNFLKGKFYLKCGNYPEAIKCFEHAVKFENIGDIDIYCGALKKLAKISKRYRELIEDDLETIHRGNKLMLDEEMLQKLRKFENEIEDEIRKIKRNRK